MNIYQLNYFTTVVEEGTLQKASSKLFVHASTISAAISGLEHEFGHYLFKHSNQGLKLTDFGERIYLQTKNILAEVNALENIVKEEDSSAPIDIVFQAGYGNEIVPNAIKEFKLQFPNISVRPFPKDLTQDGSIKVTLKSYAFALCLTSEISKTLSRKDKQAFILLGKQSSYAVLNRNSALANKKVISASDCANHTVIARPDRVEELKSLLPNSNVNGYSPASIRNYIKIDEDAIGIVPSFFCIENSSDNEYDPLVIRRAEFYARTFDCFVIHDANRPISAPEAKLLEIIQKRFTISMEKIERLLDEPA